MIHRRLAPLLALALLACGRDAPSSALTAGPKEPLSATTTPPVASILTTLTAPPPPSPPAPPPFVLTELAPTQGDLTPLLRTAAERAREKGLRPVIEFYADWCPPCRAFDAGMRTPEITGALAGTYLVKLNMDDWHDKLKDTGFTVRSIPSFFFIGTDGRPAGKMLDGDKWGSKITPARMGEALRAWLRG
jgi:thiol-disulfide isomerase/thioredoxin